MKEIFKVYEKAGGKELLKRWINAGVLPYAIGQVMLTGLSKKSLEILRNGVYLKLRNKLHKQYASVLDEFDKLYSPDIYPQKESRKVWFCWMQGIDKAPLLVKKCYKSVCKEMHGREIIFLSERNLKEWCQLPEFIWEKYQKGIITQTHLSDLLRIALLAQHGGTWIDATVYCSSACSTPDYMLDSDFFVFQNLKPGSDGSVLNISSWFMTAKKNNHIVLVVKELLWRYWQKENSLIDYFLLHHFISIVSERYSEEWKKVYQFPNSLPHVLLLSLFEKFDETRYEAMLQSSPFHKLSYKFTEEQMALPETYYKHIIRKYD
ncbi:MAG: capsular polysaccharide synthesis protein [Nitrosomonas sp.]|nr:capsular polysaccharide synthesis protein [Nitrosomonas sp.]